MMPICTPVNLRELLSLAAAKGLKLWLDGEKLAVRAPKGVMDAELRLALAEHKADLIAFLRQQSVSEPPSRIPRSPAPELAPAPLSSGQERLWFLTRLVPGSALYNLHVRVGLRGPLNPDTLQRSLSMLVARHDALRTSFPEIGGRPCAAVAPRLEFELPRVDLSALDVEARQREYERLCTEHRTAAFDLLRGPPWRMLLVGLAREEHALLITQHHIVTDGWSVGILIAGLGELYRTLAAGERVSLPELPIDYVDFARWQRELLTAEDTQRSLSFWQQQLAGLPRLQLPTGRAPCAEPTHRGDTRDFRLSPALSAALKELASRHECTLFVTLLAAWVALLHRYSHQTDFAVGTVTAGRDRPELNELLGFFVNTLVLRCDTADAPSFIALMKRLRGVLAAALAHASVPFDAVVRATGTPRGPGLNPLIQASFILENLPAPSVAIPGMSWSVHTEKADGGVEGTAKFDLGLTMIEREGALDGTIEFATDLFDPAMIARLTGHLQVLLQAAVKQPELPISALPILTDSERRQLLSEWNDTAWEFPRKACIHELFSEQARRTPDGAAVRFAERTWSYAELDARTSELAQRLAELGVGPDVLVALCIERSLEMVLGILGILKAGGAYVPIDPSYPQERIDFMLKDARPAAILSTAAQRPRLRLADAPILDLEDLPESRVAGRSIAYGNRASASNLIYALYTSGSTGEPKGVLNIHQGLVNRILWMQKQYQLRPSDRVLQKTPFSFDVSGWEFFWPLLIGACLVMAKPGGHRDPAYLKQLIEEEGITHLHFVPSMLRVFLEQEGLRTACRSVQKVYCSGEALTVEQAQRFAARLPHAELHNLYGPTEAAIDVSYYACRPSVAEASIPIGRPIANTQLYVLDAQLQPVPIGVSGELHIGGIGLARGYLNRPELTAQRFIADPFSADPGARLYKTGDLARFRPDGDIEFLGRSDHQIKLRGCRIELSEIESVLASHPEVAACAVMAREDVPGDPRLIAYVVARRGGSLDDSQLSQHLLKKLPDYMLPAAFVQLPALPCSSSGKLERKALPAPAQQRGSDSFVAPRTPVEQSLAALFAAALQLDRVGLHDDFFARGGHSLLAAALVARIEQISGKTLPLADFFRAPSVAALAQRLSGDDELSGPPPLSTDAALPADLRLPLSTAARPPRSILLTGATGFVGAFLLHELLRLHPVRVRCLVRGGGDAAALLRLRAAVAGWELAVDWQRVDAIAGELAADQLGLTDARWTELAETCDCIVHCGSEVHHTRGYASLRAANVGSTVEALRLSATGRGKRLCLVSTLSVAEATPGATEETPLAPPWQGSGYTQTKWVADRLLLTAAAAGHDVTICRLGLVVGDSEKGRIQLSGYWYTQALRACALTAAVPEGLDLPLRAVPVDLAARGIVARAFSADARPITHLGGRERLTTELLVEALRECGISVERLPRERWLERLHRAAARDPELARLLLLLQETRGAPFAEPSAQTGDTLLRELGLEPPPLKSALAASMGYLRRIGAV